MIYHATQEIADYLREKGLKLDIEETEDDSRVVLPFHVTELGIRLTFLFISNSDRNDAQIVIFGLGQSDEEHLMGFLYTINEIQRAYRYFRFTLTDKGRVIMSSDIPAEVKEVGPVAMELLERGVAITKEVYPMLMKTRWR